MWRPATTQGATSGTNDVPLGNRRRFGPAPPEGGAGGPLPPPPYPQQYPSQQNYSAPPPGQGGYNGQQQSYPPRPPQDRPYGGGPPSQQDRPYGAVPPPPGYGGSELSGPPGGGGGYDRGGPPGGYDRPPDRGRDDERKRDREEDHREPAAEEDPNAPRKRRSRWGDAAPQSTVMPTAIMGANLNQNELDQYAMRMRVEEINHKLRTGEVVPPERQRSPSPPPTYDAHGRRTNTREVRYRRKLEDERVRLVDKAMKLDPNYRPPTEYHTQKRNNRPQDKVYIPVKEFPEIKFFGLLVGPRGNSLKKMEAQTGAKISIRGKGSVKDGKGRPEAHADDADDDLHCLITADTQEKVQACVDLINHVIATAASTPEAQNDHKRNQLRELAALNGTLRDDENQVCQNCGGIGHKKWDCPEQRNYSAGITCHNCGSVGHMARDCRNPRGGGPAGPGGPPGGKFDAEYASLMNELGEGGGGSSVGRPAGAIEGGASSRPPWASGAGPDGQPGQPAQPTLAPWRDPNNWITPNQRMAMQHHQQPYGGGGGPGGYPGGGGGGGGGDYPGYSGYPGYGAPGQQPGAPAGQWGAQQQPAAQGSQSTYEAYYSQIAAASAGAGAFGATPVQPSLTTPQGAGSI